MASTKRPGRGAHRFLLLAISASLAAGCVGESAPVSAPPVQVSELLAAPKNLTIRLTDEGLRAKWAAPAKTNDHPISRYRVFVGKRPPVELPASATEYDVAKLGRNELLLVQVVAVNDAGPGRIAMAQASRPEPEPKPEPDLPLGNEATQSTPATATPAPAPGSTTAAATPPPVAEPDVGEPDVAEPDVADFVSLYRRVAPSVVSVRVSSCAGDRFMGTAFFVAPNLLATVAHVVEDFAEVRVKVDGRLHSARVVGYSEKDDLALLRIKTPFPGRQLEFATQYPAIGTEHIVVGFAEAGDGLGKSLQHGRVSAVDITYTGLQMGPRRGMIQSDVQTNHGASGGPLLTSDGRVIGMVDLAIGDPQNINLAIGAPVAAPKIARWRTSQKAVPSFC